MHLRNKQTDIQIGIGPFGAFRTPALYIKQGNQERCLGTFFSQEKADMFMDVLKKWDEAGGSDNAD